jgi:DNA-binding beta-propeller fold protein YncE
MKVIWRDTGERWLFPQGMGTQGFRRGRVSLASPDRDRFAGIGLRGGSGNGRVQVFEADGNFRTEWKDLGPPYGLLVAPFQNLYVADAEALRVSEVEPREKFLAASEPPVVAPVSLPARRRLPFPQRGKSL